jgi:hypothetical protein
MICTRRFVLPIIGLVALGLVPASSAGQPAFDGVYIARGVDSEGHEYRRAVDIEQHGDRFTVTWVAAQIVGETLVLEPIWVGVGIATGETLSVSFIAGDTLAIMVYQVTKDGELSGRWTLEGDDETVYSETLTRLSDVLPEPAAVDPPERLPRSPVTPSAGTISL